LSSSTNTTLSYFLQSFLSINVEEGIIEYHTLKDIENDKNYFGEATKNVLSLKHLQSFEDSINVYVRLK
jgi:helix-turn-helix protein